ncbi:MAG TPA: DUF4038 domain-containing protein [Hyphomicrobiaceae bacterium]|nr:DUF4038 domain-containing protein [Hyphomicrobiaceae bacterium]
MADQLVTPLTRRNLIAAGLCAAAVGALAGDRMRGEAAATATAAPPPDIAWPNAAFPLSIPAGARHLVDAHGRPFLLHGDSAWSLIAGLTREDALIYLQDRQARGFNAILVNLIEHRFCRHAPANAYGQKPFLTPGDFAHLNEAYFAHADWVVREAAERGLLVLLAPAYLGNGGGIEGWYREVVASGLDAMRRYGQTLGRRYRDAGNILWVQAGDYDPPRKDLVRAVADGIRESDTRALHTAHGGPGSAGIQHWQGEPWLQLNNVYTYGPVYAEALRQYARAERLPFVLIESAYENEHRAGELRIRCQAYQALLSGAAGQIYGNNPVWHFDGPGLFPAPASWQAQLGSRGAQSMTHVRTLLASLPWWRLVPDADGALLTDGIGSGQNRAVAAATADGKVALIYLPSLRTVRVAPDRLRGPMVRARWYDPANGTYADAGAVPAGKGRLAFRPAHANSAGMGDWVLLLESEA